MNRATACATAASAVVMGVLVGGSPAWAAPSTQVVQGEVLRLVSTADWDAASSLLPGQPVQWDVTVSALAPDPGTVEVGISAAGDAALVVDALACAQPWHEGGCPDGASVLLADWSISRDGMEVPLIEMLDTEVAHLRFIIALDGDGDGDGSGSTQVRVHARGAGESAVVGPDGGLATTGVSSVVPWYVGGGIGLGVAGFALIAARGARTVGVEEAGS